ncbi:MAG: NAD(P)/FAD-dependent oxidoreductase [Woeseiaceae bacterium]|nr:NAD(P)/FAD-dependent oxidoreductase [Woeseiaceae bacterium]
MIARLLRSVRPAGTTDVIVIGAGHAGLAASYFLREHSIDHVVLERGKVANSWREERWESLKLLTPNWQSRLPGFGYSGDSPDGFMSMPEVVEFIEGYADFVTAPVQTQTTVTSVRSCADGYRVTTNKGTWKAQAVIIASGACNKANVPGVAAALPADIKQLTAHDYCSVDQIERGDVLVVGASATGVQLADEIQRAGHCVTIAAGEHVRMPRSYRGRDIQFWMDRTSILDERYDEIDDLVRARALPSPQLIGSHETRMLDLNYLADAGATVVGRLMGVAQGNAQFSGSLRNVCALADLKMNRLLDSIDDWVTKHSVLCDAPHRFPETRVDAEPRLMMKLGGTGIRTVVWATGFRPDYSWLDIDVLDAKGRLRHDGGIVDAPGLYALGLPMMRRRKSSFIHGIEDDARDITEHLASYLKGDRAYSMCA